MCPLWQCGTKTLVCTPQIKEIKTTTTTKHGSTTASFIHYSSCNQLLCHFILFSSVWNLACLAFENKNNFHILFGLDLSTIIDSFFGVISFGVGVKMLLFLQINNQLHLAKLACLSNIIVININFSLAKIFDLSL